MPLARRTFVSSGLVFLLLSGLWSSLAESLGGAPTGSRALAAEPVAVRVMSFNIRYGTAQDGVNHWDRRREFLLETVQAFQPDLLGTQETLGFQKDWLAERLTGYATLGVGRDDGKLAGEMMALYYRTERFELLASGHFWLSETPERAGTKSWGSSLPRMVTWVKLRDRKGLDDRPVLFFNTHFDHQGEQARLQSARLVRRRLTELGAGCRLVLTGDFNAGDDQPPYAALFGDQPGEKSPVVDTFRMRFPTRGPDEGTFSSFDVGQTRGPRIDWIGASRDWRVDAAAIDHTAREGRTPSDHFPITAVLTPQAADKTNEAATNEPKPSAEAASATFVAGGPCEVDQELNVAYQAGDGANLRKHKLDLFLPRGRRDYPILFFVHGGGWVSGDRKLYSSVGRVFARNGVGTAVISYRLTPEVRHPGHIEDVAKAFAWVKQNIAERGGRADRIFVAGQSAGGHLSALLATNERYLRAEGCQLADIRGVIPISGVYDFPRGGFDAVLGTGAEAYDSAIPLRHIGAGCPPFLLLYAESDIPQCDRLSERMCELLKAQQVEAQVEKIADRNHISIMFRLMLSTRDPTTQQMLRFIGRHSELELQEQPVAGD